MTNRGFFGRVRPCSALANMSSSDGCGLGAYSGKRVYSGTGGRGTIMRGEVTYEEPMTAGREGPQFPQHDHTATNGYPPIGFASNQHLQFQKDASQQQPGTQERKYVENPHSLETRRAEAGIPQRMNSPVQNKVSEHFYKQKYNRTFPITKSRSVPIQPQTLESQNQPDLRSNKWVENPLYLQSNRVEVGRHDREAKSTNSFEQYKPEHVYSSSAIKKLQHFNHQEYGKTFPRRSVARQQYPSNYVEKTDGVSLGQSPYSQNVKHVYPVINKKLQPSWQKEYENTLPTMSAGPRIMPNQQNASNKTKFHVKSAHVEELPWAENVQNYSHVTRKSEPVYYQKNANTLPKITAVTSRHVHVPQEIQSSFVKSVKKPIQYEASYSPNELWTNQTSEPRPQVQHISKRLFSTGMDASGNHGQETSHFADTSINPLVPVTYSKLKQDHYRKRVDLIPHEVDPAHCYGLQASGD